MAQRVIGVITEGESDLLAILRHAEHVTVALMEPAGLEREALDRCDAIALIGGTKESPMLLHPRDRKELERQIAGGKKVFGEYVSSIGNVYTAAPASTRYQRIMYCGPADAVRGLEPGDLLDEQCNTRLAPYVEFGCTSKPPLLQYANVPAHRRAEPSEELLLRGNDRAIWFEEPETLLLCGFRLAHFAKARFAPLAKWRSLVGYLLEWLCECGIDTSVVRDGYTTRLAEGRTPDENDLRAAVRDGMAWFERSGTLSAGGKDGVREGIGTEIYGDGSQRIVASIRADCMGETALACAMDYMLAGDAGQLEKADRLLAGCFDWFLQRREGPLDGMMSWTDTGWGVSYQDDVARVLIPQLLVNLYLERSERLDDCAAALEFLLRTTGSDGMRLFRTDNFQLTDAKIAELAAKPSHFPSAHYNAFYMAALLLCYKQTGNEAFRRAGIKGLETIMAAYPDTTREQSQTQELCRLIFPLSCLYWVTGEERHKLWLYRVTEDLQRFRHASGGYLEWDEGYKAAMHGTKPGEESSMLTSNGDPVVDLLYSVNWLPLGFIQAYFVTGDERFLELWQDVARFLASIQIHSANPQIDGAWTRAFDVELGEVFGYPGDGGWGPWAIESGWTMGEICAGISIGLMRDRLGRYYG